MYRNKHKNNPSITSPEIARQKSIKKKIFITQKLLRILQKYYEKKRFKICFTYKYNVSDKSDCK